MKKSLYAVLCLLLVAMVCLPVVANADYYAYAKTGNGKPLNCREDQSMQAPIKFTIPYGTRVLVKTNVPVKNGFVYAEPDGYSNGAYMRSGLLSRTAPGKFVPKPKEKPENVNLFTTLDEPYFVTAKAIKSGSKNSVGLRLQPTKESKLLRRLIAGDELLVLAEGKKWLYVVDANTLGSDNPVMGYVHGDYVDFERKADLNKLADELEDVVKEIRGNAA